MTSLNGNRLLTGLCRGFESPWWRTDSNWKCQGISLLSKLWFPPWTSWQIYNVYCLELDWWLLQCFCSEIPDVMGTVLLLWSYLLIQLLMLILPTRSSFSLSFLDRVVTLTLYFYCQNIMFTCVCQKRGKKKKKIDLRSGSAVCLNSTPLRDLDSC